MFLDTVLYALIGMYIQAVLPTQEFGVPRPWYFPFSDSIKFARYAFDFCSRCISGVRVPAESSVPLTADTRGSGTTVVKRRSLRAKPYSMAWFRSIIGLQSDVLDSSLLDDDKETGSETTRFFQPLDSSLQAKFREGRCVSVRGLRKEFAVDDGVKVAVK